MMIIDNFSIRFKVFFGLAVISLPALLFSLFALLELHNTLGGDEIDRTSIIWGAALITYVVLFSLITWWIGNFLTRPIKRLTQASKQIADGKYNCKLAITSEDEIGKLGLAFNKMSTQLLLSNRKLEQQMSSTQAILDTAVDGIIIINSKGTIESFNPAAEKIFQYQSSEVIGRNVNILMPNPFKKQHDEYLSNYLKSNQPRIIGSSREVMGMRSDGNTFPVQLSVSELPDSENRRFTGIVRDISEQKAYEENILQSKREAEQANRFKSKFLSNMSHELRTPLTAIVGLAELSEYDESLSEQQKQNSSEIVSSCKYLLSILNDILDLSKIESGMLQISEEQVLFSKLLDECCNIIHPLADDKNVSINYSSDFPDDLCVIADYTRLKQVILNLLSNAIKYNKQFGEVSISYRELKDDQIEISIKDTGTGISEANQKQLFESFNRLDKELSDIEGTGIGLVMVKNLLELMGGTVAVKSREGEGSTFSIVINKGISITADKAATTDKDSIQSLAHYDGKILVAEDNPANRYTLAQQCQLLGIQVDFAASGKEALKLFKTNTYDLILTDINMPEMDGFELTRKVRLDEEEKQKLPCPIIALTANAMKEDEKKCLENGLDGFITKPIFLDDLKKLFSARLIQDDYRTTAQTEMSSPLVEDELNGFQLIDYNFLRYQVGDNLEVHQRMFQVFIEAMEEQLPRFNLVIEHEIRSELKDLCHLLKSTTRTIGATSLADRLEALENDAGTMSFDKIETEIDKVRSLYIAIKDELNSFNVEPLIDITSNNQEANSLGILIVDDDSMVSNVLSEMLYHLGYENIFSASNAMEALELVESSRGRFELIFLDLNLPDISGFECLSRLSALNFQGSVMLISGNNPISDNDVDDLSKCYNIPVVTSLQKPIDMADLQQAIYLLGSANRVRELPEVVADELE